MGEKTASLMARLQQKSQTIRQSPRKTNSQATLSEKPASPVIPISTPIVNITDNTPSSPQSIQIVLDNPLSSSEIKEWEELISMSLTSPFAGEGNKRKRSDSDTKKEKRLRKKRDKAEKKKMSKKPEVGEKSAQDDSPEKLPSPDNNTESVKVTADNPEETREEENKKVEEALRQVGISESPDLNASDKRGEVDVVVSKNQAVILSDKEDRESGEVTPQVSEEIPNTSAEVIIVENETARGSGVSAETQKEKLIKDRKKVVARKMKQQTINASVLSQNPPPATNKSGAASFISAKIISDKGKSISLPAALPKRPSKFINPLETVNEGRELSHDERQSLRIKAATDLQKIIKCQDSGRPYKSSSLNLNQLAMPLIPPTTFLPENLTSLPNPNIPEADNIPEYSRVLDSLSKQVDAVASFIQPKPVAEAYFNGEMEKVWKLIDSLRSDTTERIRSLKEDNITLKAKITTVEAENIALRRRVHLLETASRSAQMAASVPVPPVATTSTTANIEEQFKHYESQVKKDIKELHVLMANINRGLAAAHLNSTIVTDALARVGMDKPNNRENP